jgi:hypothetical protein
MEQFLAQVSLFPPRVSVFLPSADRKFHPRSDL